MMALTNDASANENKLDTTADIERIISPSSNQEWHAIRGKKSKNLRLKIHELTSKYAALQEKYNVILYSP